MEHPFIIKYNRGNKLIAELVNNSMDDLEFYRKKILESDESEEEDKITEIIKNKNTNKYKIEQKTNNSQNNYIEGKYESGSVIIKDNNSSKNELNVSNIVDDTQTMINVDKDRNINSIQSRNKEEEEQGSVVIKKTDKKCEEITDLENENQLKKMIDMYGIDGLSFEYNKNPDKTIKAEETKMVEQRDIIEKNEIKLEENSKGVFNDKMTLSDLINDSSVNNLTTVELKSKILTIEEEMKNEIQKIKEFYKQKLFKYKISLQFLKGYQFLKNLSEYNDYQKFINKMRKQIEFPKEKIKINKEKDKIYQINAQNININNNINFNEYNNNYNKIEINNYNVIERTKENISPEFLNKNRDRKYNISSSENLIPSTSTVKPNHVLVFNYKPNNISIKKQLVYQ